MHRAHTKVSLPVFTEHFQKISPLCSIRSSTLNFSKPRLKLTKTKYRISFDPPTIRYDFVKDCLKSIAKTRFFKVKMKSTLPNPGNETNYF